MTILLKLDGITKKYKDVLALNDLNLELEEGKIIGLLGPNGSGKTTLIKIVAGLMTDFKGTVHYEGHLISPDDRKYIAYLPDHPYLSNRYTVKSAVNFYNTFFDNFNKGKALDLIDKFEIPINKSVKNLSKGTIEKLQLILTLSRDAKLYIFDEPLAAVDPAFRDFLFNLILEQYNKQSTIIFSTHLIYDVENFLNDVIFIKNGKVILHKSKQEINDQGNTVEGLFKEVFKWSGK